MKKLFGFLGALVIAFSLTACGISQKTADKINEAAEADEHYTTTTLVDEFGAPTMDITILSNGVMIWVNGCDTLEEVEAKWDDGKTVKALVVGIAFGKAISASYDEDFTKDDFSIL